MARAQTWSRNINKKIKKTSTPGGMVSKPIVNDEPLKALKRRAEEWGLIIHARPDKKQKGGKK